jgi:hypothetical protein
MLTRPTTTRERRVVVWGVAIVLVALLVVRGVMPFAERWRLRESQLTAARDRAAQLAGLEQATTQLQQRATIAERALSGALRRVLHARSEALAASALQALLQDAVDGAGMIVNRVEVGPETGNGQVSASLSVVGDVHGLATLLSTLERGPRVLFVERLTVVQNSALRGAPDVLQVTLAVRAPVVIE